MNNIKEVRKVGLWVIAGVTLLTLMVLNVRQDTTRLNVVVWAALIALAVWLVVTAFVSWMKTRKRGDQ